MSSKADKPLTRAKAAKRLGVFPSALPDVTWSSARVRKVRREQPRPEWLVNAYQEYRLAGEERAQQKVVAGQEETAWRAAPAPPRHRAPASRAPRAVNWVSVPILRTRGWTDTAIRNFLPDPEKTRANPHFSTAGAPQRLWSPGTVGRAEATPKWQAWLEKSLARRKTTLAALAYPSDDEEFLATLQRVQDAVDAAIGEQQPALPA
ncbi:hypothetical protein [Streptomyces sp. NPDC001933]|uniref:hypothetical protein n=1 Tax=Streptomyces sp. NPDC001933 TaxID=3364626 RepID=UPI003676E155